MSAVQLKEMSDEDLVRHVRMGLGRDKPYFTVENGPTYNKPGSILPEDGRMWPEVTAPKGTEEYERQKREQQRAFRDAGFSPQWMKDWMRREEVVAQDPRQRFLDEVAGNIGVEPQQIILQSDIEARRKREVIQLEQVRATLRRRNNLNRTVRQQILASQKEREKLNDSASKALATKLQQRSLAAQVERLRGQQSSLGDVTQAYRTVGQIADSALTMLNSLPGRYSLLELSELVRSRDPTVGGFIRNPSFQGFVKQLAGDIERLQTLTIPADENFPPLLASTRNLIREMAQPGFALDDSARPRMHRALNYLIGQPPPNLLEAVAATKGAKLKTKMLAALRTARKLDAPPSLTARMVLPRSGDKPTRKVSNLYADYERALLQLVKDTAAERVKNESESDQKLVASLQETLAKGWEAVAVFMQEEGLVDVDIRSAVTAWKENRRGKSAADKIRVDEDFWGELLQIVQTELDNLPPDNRLNRLLYTEATRQRFTDVQRRQDPMRTSLFIMRALAKYLEDVHVPSLRDKIAEKDNELTELMRRNAQLLETEAQQAEDPQDRSLDPIRHRAEWVQLPENTGRVRVIPLVTSSINRCVEDLVRLSPEMGRLVDDYRYLEQERPDDPHIKAGGVEQLLQESLMRDNVAYVTFAQMVGNKIGLTRDKYPKGWKRASTTDSLQADYREAFKELILLNATYSHEKKLFVFARPTQAERNRKRARMMSRRRQVKRQRSYDPNRRVLVPHIKSV